MTSNPLTKAQLAEINRGLYAINEAEQHVAVLERMGENVDETKLRMEHLKMQLQVLRDEYGGKS